MASSPQPISRTCPQCLAPFDTVDAPKLGLQIPSDILDTNRPPTDPEILCIQSVIAEERTRKTRLEARIAALQVLLNTLMADHDSLEEEIRTHEGTLSLLRRMPPELLSLTFVFASRSTRFDRRDPAPWTVSQVCRRWRAIVLSQPSFWASIDLDFGRIVDGKTKTTFRLEAQLKRSGNLPLYIDFGCRFKYDSTEQESGLLDVLAQNSARWENIRIYGPLSLSVVLARIRGNLPLLRKLRVLFQVHPREEGHSVDVFELAPNLREAYVNMEENHQEPVDVMLPLSRLLQYAARNTWDGHLRTLRSASNLVECALDVADISMPPTTLVALPHLRRLALLSSNLLDCLDAPQLEELYCCSQSNHLSSLFLRRPPRELQKLVLFFPASVADIVGILRSVPTITDIGVSIPSDAFNELAATFTLRNEPTDIGLALKSIIICRGGQRADFWFRYNEDTLVNMVTSRWRGGRLRSITVPDSQFFYGGERLEPAQSEGLKLIFSSGFTYDQTHIAMVPPHLQFKNSHL